MQREEVCSMEIKIIYFKEYQNEYVIGMVRENNVKHNNLFSTHIQTWDRFF